MCKYSILLPVYNGENFLPTCINTIISQEYSDYELIISDAHSTDSSWSYLQTLQHKNIKILRTPHKMSMAEHWEWVLKYAQGQWCIFVGQDDGLQSYFFFLADQLTAYADRKKIRTIMSDRAYYFWPGYENIFGDTAVAYTATPDVRIYSTKQKLFEALTGIITYFDLPEMYTTSLFHRDLLDEVRVKQKTYVFTTHPQDANLAAIACSLEKKYIHSCIPLGWVGTSPKSAGMAIGSMVNIGLRTDYLDKIQKSNLRYCPLAGEFSLDILALYFWGALVQTQSLRGQICNLIIMSKAVKYFVFLASYSELCVQKATPERRIEFERTMKLNECSMNVLMRLLPAYKLYKHLYAVLKKMLKLITLKSKCKICYYAKQQDNISMLEASSNINNIIYKTFFSFLWDRRK